MDTLETSNDEVVFFFSGHAVRGLAQDSDKERVDEGICVWGYDEFDNPIMTYIWDGESQAAFSGFLTSRIIFVFDTCLAGGMEKDLEEPGRVIAMATSENGTAVEGDFWENGEFSYYFVDLGMEQGQANTHDYDENGELNEPGQVTVEEAFDYAKANCAYDRPTIGDEFDDDLLP
ncbi:MAG: caspase family protein [Planctomycetota bacterium]|nr:caspase family protein [Planctomycetota bacterium]